MAGKYFYPRGEFSRVGLNKVALDFLDHVSALLNDRLTIATHDTDLTALQAEADQSRTDVAALQAKEAEAWILAPVPINSSQAAQPVQPFGFAFERDLASVVVSKAVRSFDTPVAWSLPTGLADCQATIVDSTSVTAAAPTADTDFDLQVSGASVGTMRFANGSLTATFIKAADTAVPLGEITRIVAPANLHGMAGTLTGSIKGTR